MSVDLLCKNPPKRIALWDGGNSFLRNFVGHFGKYHNTLCLALQILHKHCFQLGLGALGTYNGPKRKQKQCLCKIWGAKQRVLWHFPKWAIAAALSEPEANERGSSLIGRRTHFSSKRKGLWSKAQGIMTMREWRN